jgi:hypothetical protein
MRFGFESEKLIYDAKQNKISDYANRILVILEDYKVLYGEDEINRVTGEFVFNMIELSSSPSESVFDVARDYLFSYELIRDASKRLGKTVLPIASYPLHHAPSMVPKWAYYLQNAVLSHDAEIGWKLLPEHKLYPAANCAGVHLHAEIDTFPEYLSFTDELVNKYNLAVSLVPLNAFASSPYWESHREANSTRCTKYFRGIYGPHPENGGIPQIYTESAQVVKQALRAYESWKGKAEALGFSSGEVRKILQKSGAHWGMVRWNRKWNTVEMRCFDTDLVGMDVGKFTLASRALKRTDLQGEALRMKAMTAPSESIANDPAKLDTWIAERLSESLAVSGGDVQIFPTAAIQRLIILAMEEGLSNDLVYQYNDRILNFATAHMSRRERWMADEVITAFQKREATSDWMLKETSKKKTLRKEDVDSLMATLLEREERQFQRVSDRLPEELKPPKEHPGPAKLS